MILKFFDGQLLAEIFGRKKTDHRPPAVIYPIADDPVGRFLRPGKKLKQMIDAFKRSTAEGMEVLLLFKESVSGNNNPGAAASWVFY